MAEDGSHGSIFGQNVRSERRDIALASCLDEIAEEQPPDAATLHLVDDREGDLRGVRRIFQANETSHADPDGRIGIRLDIERDGLGGDGDVVPPVDAQQVPLGSLRQSWHRRKEAEVARARRQAFERREQPVAIAGLEETELDRGSVSEPMDLPIRIREAQRLQRAPRGTVGNRFSSRGS
jgi:hypothetical protein